MITPDDAFDEEMRQITRLRLRREPRRRVARRARSHRRRALTALTVTCGRRSRPARHAHRRSHGWARCAQRSRRRVRCRREPHGSVRAVHQPLSSRQRTDRAQPPTTYLACALAQQACRKGHRAIYRRASRLFSELALARARSRRWQLPSTAHPHPLKRRRSAHG